MICWRWQSGGGWPGECYLGSNASAWGGRCRRESTDPAVYNGPVNNYTDFCYVWYFAFIISLILIDIDCWYILGDNNVHCGLCIIGESISALLLHVHFNSRVYSMARPLQRRRRRRPWRRLRKSLAAMNCTQLCFYDMMMMQLCFYDLSWCSAVSLHHDNPLGTGLSGTRCR